MATACASLLGRHVVEQHGVHAGFERLTQLIQRVDLDFDLHHVADVRAHCRNRGADRSGDCKMIVFDQHRVVQAEAMVGSAAAAHGVLFENAQAGCRFARADDVSGMLRHRIHQNPGCAGDAAEPAKNVERRAFAGKHRAGPACDRGDRFTRLHPLAVGNAHVELRGCVQEREGQARGVRSGNDAGFSCDDPSRCKRIGGDDRVGRQIPPAADVFQERRANDRFDEQRRRRATHSVRASVPQRCGHAVPLQDRR